MLAKIAVGILIIGFFGTPILMALGMAFYTLAAGWPLWLLLGVLTWLAYRLMPTEEGEE